MRHLVGVLEASLEDQNQLCGLLDSVMLTGKSRFELGNDRCDVFHREGTSVRVAGIVTAAIMEGKTGRFTFFGGSYHEETEDV